MNTFINNKQGEYEDYLNKVFGYSEYDLIIKPENLTDSHDIYCRVIINGGSVRNNMYKGEITKSKFRDVLPWYNILI